MSRVAFSLMRASLPAGAASPEAYQVNLKFCGRADSRQSSTHLAVRRLVYSQVVPGWHWAVKQFPLPGAWRLSCPSAFGLSRVVELSRRFCVYPANKMVYCPLRRWV
eukprot:6185860-Pleurochrysis_carterae.AAC.7